MVRACEFTGEVACVGKGEELGPRGPAVLIGRVIKRISASPLPPCPYNERERDAEVVPASISFENATPFSAIEHSCRARESASEGGCNVSGATQCDPVRAACGRVQSLSSVVRNVKGSRCTECQYLPIGDNKHCVPREFTVALPHPKWHLCPPRPRHALPAPGEPPLPCPYHVGAGGPFD